MMDVPVPLPAQNPWRTSCKVTEFLIRASIIASVTLQRTYRIPIPQVYCLPLGIMINIVHPSSAGIVLCSHMNWTISTSFINLGEAVASFSGYDSLRHILKCLACSWVWPPALFTLKRRTDASTSTSAGTLSPIYNGVTWVKTDLPGGWGSSF